MKTRYKLEIREPKGLTVKDWIGKASDEALHAYLNEYRQAIGRLRGYKPMILQAKIVTAKTQKTVAEYQGYTVG